MLIIYCFAAPILWIVPYIIQTVSYMRILKRMGKKRIFGLVPLLGEWQMSQDVFRRRRQFFRPAVVAAALMLTAWYVGFDSPYGRIMMFVSFIVYGIFLCRLYWRLAKRFGRGKLFALGMIFIAGIFLPILAFGRKEYLGPAEFKPGKERSKTSRMVRRTALAAISIVEVGILVVGCFVVTLYAKPFRPMSQYLLNENIERLSGIKDDGRAVTRSDVLGEEADKIAEAAKSREHYQKPYEEGDKIVVMEYIIGSNLENRVGSASLNIAQMKDATKRGDSLKFVVQAGGSDRWFTKGISDKSVGRYEISGGDLKEKESLPGSLSMSDQESLEDFIKWAKEEYPADRYMLVLWDHGGGFAGGYGIDDLNERTKGGELLTSAEIISSVKASGIKFDMIGFDACLMQGIEMAKSLEPYADYFLASQESEPGTGWYYTDAFGALAEDPTLSMEEFGKKMVSTYDQVNKEMNDGKVNPEFTLSLVDLALVDTAYDALADIYSSSAQTMPDDPTVFADFSAARAKAYQFGDFEQVDAVDFLTYLKRADYRDDIAKDADIEKLIKNMQACVVCRNKDSAEGISGISVDFPYEDMTLYSQTYKQLKKLKFRSQEKFFNNFCSILVSQNTVKASGAMQQFAQSTYKSLKSEPWYVEGYEDYDTVKTFVDIPMTETEEGYIVELPDSAWDIVTDAVTAAYMVTDKGRMYLGTQHLGGEDADGHPLVTMDDTWVKIGGELVSYEADTPAETKDGIVYKGKTKALLNGEEEIELQIEWDPVKEEGDPEAVGHVKGYTRTDNPFSFMEKGLIELESGDTLQFMFDWYDENGKVIKTGTYGNKVRVVTQDKLSVKDEALPPCEIEFLGVLTDVYQRELLTEVISATIE